MPGCLSRQNDSLQIACRTFYPLIGKYGLPRNQYKDKWSYVFGRMRGGMNRWTTGCCPLVLCNQLLMPWILNMSKACSTRWILPKSLCWHHLSTLHRQLTELTSIWLCNSRLLVANHSLDIQVIDQGASATGIRWPKAWLSQFAATVLCSRSSHGTFYPTISVLPAAEQAPLL